MADFWTTDNVATTEQTSYWTDVLCQAFTPLAPTRSRDHLRRSRAGAGLPGRVRSSAIGAVNAAEISSCTQLIRHGRSEVSRASEDVVFVNLQIDGLCIAEQDDRQCTVSRGQFTIVDSTRPYSLEFVEPEQDSRLWRVLSMRLPRDNVADFLTGPASGGTATTFDAQQGSANVVRSLMISTWNAANSLETAVERHLLGTAHTEVLRAALAGAHARSGPSLPSGTVGEDQTRRAAALRYVDSHLSAGPVSPADAARAVGVSARTLQAIFERTGTTFGSEARRRRLEAAKRDLGGTGKNMSIADVAARWGYADSAHMARSFRSHVGCTPSQYRDGLSRRNIFSIQTKTPASPDK